MVFENRVRRKMFGSRREEVTADWKKIVAEVSLCQRTD
jgi:hypothetical protein